MFWCFVEKWVLLFSNFSFTQCIEFFKLPFVKMLTNLSPAPQEQSEDVNKVKEQAIYKLGKLYAKLGYKICFLLWHKPSSYLFSYFSSYSFLLPRFLQVALTLLAYILFHLLSTFLLPWLTSSFPPSFSQARPGCLSSLPRYSSLLWQHLQSKDSQNR